MFTEFRERNGERKKHQLVASPTRPNQGLKRQPRYVPRLTAFWCGGVMLQPTEPPDQGQNTNL